MTRKLKLGLAVFTAVMMVFSIWTIASAADPAIDESNYDVEIVDTLTYDGETYTSLGDHGKYVKSQSGAGTIYLDQNYKDVRNLNDVKEMDLPTILTYMEDKVDEYDKGYEWNYFSILHVKAKTGTGNVLVQATDQGQGDKDHVWMYEIPELSSSADKYYLVFVNPSSVEKDSFFHISQDGYDGMLNIEFVKGRKFTTFSVYESEIEGQTEDSDIASYFYKDDQFQIRDNYTIAYVVGDTMYFHVSKAQAANHDPNDEVKYKLFDGKTEITKGVSVEYDSNKTDARVSISQAGQGSVVIGKTYTLKIIGDAVGGADSKTGRELSRPEMNIKIMVKPLVPIQTMNFKKTSYEITTQYNNQIDLNQELVVTPEDCSDRIVYRSENENIATVNKRTGVVTAVAPGTTKIIAYSNRYQSQTAECTLKVRPDLESINIYGPNNIVQNHEAEVSYSLSPGIDEGVNPKSITWTTSDTAILRVSQQPNTAGVVKIKAVKDSDLGPTGIKTVKLIATASNGKVAEKWITVIKNEATSQIKFTTSLIPNSGKPNLDLALVPFGYDENNDPDAYNIYDEQTVKILSELIGGTSSSTDVLEWRVTVQGSKDIVNAPLDEASSFFSYDFRETTNGKPLELTFKKSKYGLLTFTAYAINKNDPISNYHAAKSITFSVNQKTEGGTYSYVDQSYKDNVAVGDKFTIHYDMNPPTDYNIDSFYVVSNDKTVLNVLDHRPDGLSGEIDLEALKQGTAKIYVYATYDMDATTSTQGVDKTYYTYKYQAEITVKKNINSVQISQNIADKTFKNADFTADNIKNELRLKNGSTTLVYDRDYTLSLKDNKNAGVCTVTIKGKGTFAGSRDVTFNILPYDISDSATLTVNGNGTNNIRYTGLKLRPDVNLKVIGVDGNPTIKVNDDFTVAYVNNTNAGEQKAYVTATGRGNYKGSVKAYFTIKPGEINNGSLVKIANLSAVTYTGKAFTPNISAQNVNTQNKLVKGTDYTLAYENNTDHGSATVKVTGKGNYAGSSVNVFFTINQREINDSNISVAAVPAQTYNNGKGLTPKPVVTYNGMTLVEDVDYNLGYADNANAGTATITINGKGNYKNNDKTGGRKVQFKINPYKLTASNTTVTFEKAEYTGEARTPGVKVNVTAFDREIGRNDQGKGDFKVTYSNNINAGSKAVATIVGTKNYTGTVTKNFFIDPTHVNNMNIANVPDEFYNGKAHKPDISATNRATGAKLKIGIDYTLEYEKNIDQGRAQIIVKGKGNYTGMRDNVGFNIKACEISSTTIAAVPNQTFIHGEGFRPKPKVTYGTRTLVEGTDYRIDYKDNVNVGTATMTFVGLGDFGGTTTRTFKIVPYKLTSSNVKITVDSVSYDGKAKTPNVKVVLSANGRELGRNDDGNSDYMVSYSNNVNSGVNTATVTITGTKNFTGTASKKFSIEGIAIDRAGNENIEPQAYTGKAVTPKVKLTFMDRTLKEGVDYKVAYKDNVKPGEATITVTGLGNFYNTKTIKFRIKEAPFRINEDSTDVIAGNSKKLNFSADEKVTWKSSNTKICTVNKDGEIKGKMAGQVTITGTSASGFKGSVTVQVLYKDVTNTGDFWYNPTYYLTNIDVVKGYDNQTNFKPANECTRGQMVTFLWRLQGCPNPKATKSKFKDVKSKDYFFKAVLWGNEKHIVEGYKDGTFGPQIVCQRKHAVTFMWRLAGKPAPKTTKNKFKDVKKSDYFYKAVLWASEKKIVEGYAGGKFKPDGNCLRRQMVTFLYKYDKYVNGKG